MRYAGIYWLLGKLEIVLFWIIMHWTRATRQLNSKIYFQHFYVKYSHLPGSLSALTRPARLQHEFLTVFLYYMSTILYLYSWCRLSLHLHHNTVPDWPSTNSMKKLCFISCRNGFLFIFMSLLVFPLLISVGNCLLLSKNSLNFEITW